MSFETEELPYFVFIGGSDAAGAKVRLKTSGVYYCKKMLESGTDNWRKIHALLASSNALGALVKLNDGNCRLIATREYREVANLVFGALSSLAHVIFIHEAILASHRREANDESACSRTCDNFSPSMT